MKTGKIEASALLCVCQIKIAQTLHMHIFSKFNLISFIFQFQATYFQSPSSAEIAAALGCCVSKWKCDLN